MRADLQVRTRPLNTCSSDSSHRVANWTARNRLVAIFKSLTFSTIFPTSGVPRHIPRRFVARRNIPATNPQIRSLGRPIRVPCMSSTLCPLHVFFHTTSFHARESAVCVISSGGYDYMGSSSRTVNCATIMLGIIEGLRGKRRNEASAALPKNLFRSETYILCHRRSSSSFVRHSKENGHYCESRTKNHRNRTARIRL